MAEETKSKTSFWSGLKQQWYKIIWQSPDSVGKQSTAVIAVSLVVGLIIVVLDKIINYGVDFLVNL